MKRHDRLKCTPNRAIVENLTRYGIPQRLNAAGPDRRREKQIIYEYFQVQYRFALDFFTIFVHNIIE